MDMDKIGKVSERPFGRSLISFILILTILLGFLPTTAFAAETMTVSDPDALEQIGTITIEGNDYNLYRLVVDTVQYNAIEFSDASSCAITTVVPVMGKKPAAIGATNLINVAPDSENYSKGEALYQSSISSNLSEEILDGLRTDTDKLGYYLYTVKRGKINTIIGVLILEWPEASQEVEGANKDELQRVIAGAGLISSSDYYQAEDYYNGKTTSSDGFWQDFQTALKTAKEILDNITATQEDVNGATASLNAAIANLIPANQVNATVLYEAIQEVEIRGYRQEDYTPETWEPFAEALEYAKAVLADKNAAQAQVDEAMKALTEKMAALAETAGTSSKPGDSSSKPDTSRPGDTSNPDDSSSQGGTSQNGQNTPQTGDQFYPGVFIVLIGACLLSSAAYVLIKQRGHNS